MTTPCSTCPFIATRAVAGLLNDMPDEFWDAARSGDDVPCMGAAVEGLVSGAGGADSDALRRVQQTDTEQAPEHRVSMKQRVCTACAGKHCVAASALASGRDIVNGEPIMGRDEFVSFHTSDTPIG